MVGSTGFPRMLLGLGNESSSSSSATGSRRKEKKKMKKPLKQPQRGLGVAQLEKILLHNQIMAANSSHHHINKFKQDAGRAPAPLHMGYHPSSPSSSSSSSVATTAASSSSSSSSCRSSLFDLHPNSMIDFGDSIVGIVMRNGLTFHSTPPATSSTLPPLFGKNSKMNNHQGHDQGYSLSQSVCGSQELDLELRL